MRRVAIALLFVASAAGCHRFKKNAAADDDAGPAAGATTLACQATADCPSGWVCMAQRCTDPRSKAIYTDPANAVTPGKVRKEVEQQLEHREQVEEKTVKSLEQ